MKTMRKIYLILGLLLMALPALSLPFFRDAANTEKRELSRLPALWKEEGLNPAFSEEMNTWVQEHIGFRGPLIAANSRLRASVLRQSVKDGVIVGRDGWLFYGETADDYLNIPSLTERAAAGAARSLRLLEDYAEARGARFLFLPVPNKSTLYGQYMPGYYRPLDEEGTLEKLLRAAAAEGVRTADLRSSFAAAGRELYQKTDSHWTYEGALLAYRSLLDAAGLERERFEGLRFTAKKNWPADLAVFLYGEAAGPDIQTYPDREFTYYYTSRNPAVDSLTLETGSADGSGSVLVFRDSFFNTLQAYVAQSFAEAGFSRLTPYRADLIATRKPDLVILEIAERNLKTLAESAPVMPAPQVFLDLSAYEVPDGLTVCRTEKADGLIHLFGQIDKRLLEESYRVYVIAEKNGAENAYEAFPVCEKELLGLKEADDNGFSAYLEEELAEGRLSLLIRTGTRNYICPVKEN